MANQENWCFIVNPTAGGGHGKTILPQLETQLSSRSLNAEILLTDKHDHAVKLSKQSLDRGFSHIIAVGGDGTMNEVARPLIGQDQVTTGLIPAGTGNINLQSDGVVLPKPDAILEVYRLGISCTDPASDYLAVGCEAGKRGITAARHRSSVG